MWQQVPGELHRAALLQLLIAVCFSVGSDHGTLPPAQTVALIKQVVMAGGAAV
ncbi:hypothetical protein AB0442_38370 [Kitasatospora sp. NPDC085895]|uniref:hypothetical protein n=1 Tax=Kitasatospora sp. NPDC085895 TaxID=3155057 RepID=UPI00344FF3A7